MDINTSMSSVKSTSDSNSSNNRDRSTDGDDDWKAHLKQLEEEEARQEEQKYEHRNDFYHMPRSSRPWTPEEKKALEILVRKNRMRRNMWSLIAGSQVDIGDGTTITLARTPQSCMRKWKTSHRPKHHLMGRWSESEVDRLKIALRSQIGSEHQLILNVRKDSQVVSTSETDKQDTRPPLKEGSFLLKALDWDRIARVVGTRDSNQCYKRFYSTMTNGRKGPWTRGEIELLEEAFSKYSNQWKPVAAYIGSRSPPGVALEGRAAMSIVNDHDGVKAKDIACSHD
ncbi:Myb-like DNA-binding domain protein [Dissophora globulifera]|nr:Myb-like DNA-binding domain protein [Dissophora globulifera]